MFASEVNLSSIYSHFCIAVEVMDKPLEEAVLWKVFLDL
jgi:hypothetical protein